jgi:DNA-binding MarR family transcriptional regulator
LEPVGPTASRREQAEDAIVLGLLDVVEGNSKVTQRHLAEELGIALGLANAYLRRCVRKGFLKVSEVPARRYVYYLTPQGFAEKSRLTAQYLSASFDFMRRARSELADLFAYGATHGRPRFLLVGQGDLADVATLVAASAHAEIVGTLPADRRADRLKEAALDHAFDLVMVTATEGPQEVFSAALEAFGSDRVCAPKLLRVRAPAEVGHE